MPGFRALSLFSTMASTTSEREFGSTAGLIAETLPEKVLLGYASTCIVTPWPTIACGRSASATWICAFNGFVRRIVATIDDDETYSPTAVGLLLIYPAKGA